CLWHKGALPLEAPLSVLFGLHGKTGVTSVTCHRGYIYSTGRDGVYRQLRLQGHAALNVFITGSEDTTACILALSEHSRAVVSLARLSDHISSVRALALAGDEDFSDKGLSALLFSAGGRAQMECYRLLCAGDPDSESAVACQVVHVASHRLDEHWERKKNRHKLVKMDPETRYMSLSVVPGTSTKQLPTPWKFVAAACSDGSVRVFGLLEAARKLVLVAESFHHQRCVLKVEAFLHTQAGGERRHLLCSAATDGSLVFWDITSPIADAVSVTILTKPVFAALGTPLLTIMAHSCGVNSLHIRETPEGRYLVASGSDDGSIHACLTTFFHVPDLAELDCWEVAEADRELKYYCVLCGQGLEMLHSMAPP
uniref:tRNA (34-2'-O)-methyltransferase regulator WDR6 n=1 Tax=Bubo bubo TaxID=30461 RepID=A0A8C0ECT5_BUBBB